LLVKADGRAACASKVSNVLGPDSIDNQSWAGLNRIQNCSSGKGLAGNNANPLARALNYSCKRAPTAMYFVVNYAAAHHDSQRFASFVKKIGVNADACLRQTAKSLHFCAVHAELGGSDDAKPMRLKFATHEDNR
jgi:hypothetical protein